MTTSVVDAKDHLGILDSSQDTLISRLLESAIDACNRYIGSENLPDELPPIFDQAVLMTVAALYEGREGAAVPDDARVLLADLRPWVFG
jgi:hypothetical protein